MEIRMLSYIYHAFSTFRFLFSRQRSYILFCFVILGFMGSTDINGISSFCRFFQFATPGYLALLHFFRSNAYDLDAVTHHWQDFVLQSEQVMKYQGRIIVIGDHTSNSKEGRKMPGVKTLCDSSETQSKPSFFRGHMWGALGVLVGSPKEPFCLPMSLRLHQGFLHIIPEGISLVKKTVINRMMLMAMNFANNHNQPILLILDAYFSVSSVFQLANCLLCQFSEKALVNVLTRAKKSYVACCINPISFNGTQWKLPERIKLYNVFDLYPFLFTECNAVIYGRNERVKLLSLTLYWPPASTQIRFIFAHTSRGKIVLMSNDLDLSAIDALLLYCLRFRIETMFQMLKSVIGAFSYHFWTEAMPTHSRKAVSNEKLQAPLPENVAACQKAWSCYERFVIFGAIAQGLLQLLALKYKDDIWKRFCGFLRTRSRALPSEQTVKSVMATLISKKDGNINQQAIIMDIEAVLPESLKQPMGQASIYKDPKA